MGIPTPAPELVLVFLSAGVAAGASGWGIDGAGHIHKIPSNNPEAFRRSMVDAGFLRPDAPLSTETIVEHMAVFYDTIREPGPLTITGDYASAVVRRFFDVRSPVAGYVSVPRSYVILQRINLGLFAVLGELSATADWRAIAEEIWPFVNGPASTPIGEAEARWYRERGAAAPVQVAG